jgi:hypothetical protein
VCWPCHSKQDGLWAHDSCRQQPIQSSRETIETPKMDSAVPNTRRAIPELECRHGGAMIQFVKQFLRIMGQPIDQTAALQSVLLTVEEAVNLMYPPPPTQTTSAEGGATIVESTD